MTKFITIFFVVVSPPFLSFIFFSTRDVLFPSDYFASNFSSFSYLFLCFALVEKNHPMWFKWTAFLLPVHSIIFQELIVFTLRDQWSLFTNLAFFEIYTQKILLASLFIPFHYALVFKEMYYPADLDFADLNKNRPNEIEEKMVKLQQKFLNSEEILKKALQQLQDKNQQISLQNEELQSIQEEVVSQKELIEEQYQLLEQKNELNKKLSLSTFDLTKNITYSDRVMQDDLMLICKNVTETLKIEYCSIWELTENELILIVFYDAQKNEYLNGISFHKEEFPRYFNAISLEKIIVADDVATDPRTNEFQDIYFSKFGIKKMIDIPFFEKGKTKGILSCETTRTNLDWQNEEVFYIKSIADVVTIAQMTQSLKDDFLVLEEKNKLIQDQNQILKSQKDEIKRINDFLESRVAERTKVLNDKNKKIAEYAFINSHLLRGPLARIMGLVNILKKDSAKYPASELELICNHLDTSCVELDEIIKKINKIVTEIE